jgi:hypothetical protein
MANQISLQTTETLSLLTSALNIHLNIGQNLAMNTPSVFMSLETTSIESLSNKIIKQTENAHIQIPTNFQLDTPDNTSITLRVNLFISYFCIISLIFLVIGSTTCFIW